PSTLIRSRAGSAWVPSSTTGTPFTETRPERISCSAARREARPASAMSFWRRTAPTPASRRATGPRGRASGPRPGGLAVPAGGGAGAPFGVGPRLEVGDLALDRRVGLAGRLHRRRQLAEPGRDLEGRQLREIAQAEVLEELPGGAVEDRAARGVLPPHHADQ